MACSRNSGGVAGHRQVVGRGRIVGRGKGRQTDDYSQKAVALKLRGTPRTKLTFALDAPRKARLVETLGEPAESSEALFTAEFPHESAMVDRVVFEEDYRTSFSVPVESSGNTVNWYYVRVVQANGQMAWSSPIWVEKA